jgi:hypothetical protein
MAGQQMRFGDGAASERMMGTWRRLAGELFVDWLAPRPGQRCQKIQHVTVDAQPHLLRGKPIMASRPRVRP